MKTTTSSHPLTGRYIDQPTHIRLARLALSHSRQGRAALDLQIRSFHEGASHAYRAAARTLRDESARAAAQEAYLQTRAA